MNWQKRYIMATFLFLVVLFFELPAAEVEAKERFEKMSENETFELYADDTNGEFYVSNKVTGDKWYSNPQDRENDSVANDLLKKDMSSQLIVKYIDIDAGNETSVNSCMESTELEACKLSEIENGFSMMYEFPDRGSKIQMEVRLIDDYIEVVIPTEQLVEASPHHFYAITVLPFFGAGSSEEVGYMLVPDGSGALIHFNNGKQHYDDYRQTIYGSDLAKDELMRGSVQQEVRMPVFGAQNGSNGFLAVVTDGDALGTINARVSGTKTSYNQVFCEFSLRTSEVKNLGNDNLVTVYSSEMMKTKNLTIRYYLLSDACCDYNAMAQVYRKYLVEEQGMVKQDDSEEMPFYVELYGAIRKNDHFLGIPITITEPLTDYASAVNLLEEMNDKGLNNIVLKYTNANVHNVMGTYLKDFRTVDELGSRRKLNELMDYCTKNNITLSFNADLVTFKKSAFPGMDKYLLGSRSITDIPVSRYRYKLSTDCVDETKKKSFLVSPAKIGESTEKFIKSIKKLNIRNMSLDTLGSYLYSDYYKARSGRQESIEYFRGVLEKIAQSTDSIMLSDANAYMLPYAKYVEDIPQQSSGFNICDEGIPFYQLAVNGLISYATSAINFDANPYKAVLQAIESGSSLKYTWITGDPSEIINTEYTELYGTDSDEWMESAIENYHILNDIYKKSEGTQLISHKIINSDEREITYENGVRVIINYKDESFMVIE